MTRSDETPTTVHRLDTPLLTPSEAAELLAVKPSWIYEAVRAGTLPCLRIGRHIRFTRSMLEDWLQGTGGVVVVPAPMRVLAATRACELRAAERALYGG